jgi:hypothetical protein
MENIPCWFIQGKINFGMPKFGPQCIEIVYISLKFKPHIRACATSGKDLSIL